MRVTGLCLFLDEGTNESKIVKYNFVFICIKNIWSCIQYTKREKTCALTLSLLHFIVVFAELGTR